MQSSLCDNAALSLARSRASSHGANLPAVRRKKLGQFFTGLPLARLLAALGVREPCGTAIDPMAGTGDLLDAVAERCHRRGLSLQCVDAIEICTKTAAACRDRLSAWSELSTELEQHVHAVSAFDAAILNKLKRGTYDLAITNPPYVRYQTVAKNDSNGADAQSPDMIRRELLNAVDALPSSSERPVWRALVEGYSGLSDMSVPSWLLAAMFVKPGGVLALVAPATWRSRDYADVLQYLIARFFSLDAVVADVQPGWFSDALVRTHLVVATRLHAEEASVPLVEREDGMRSYTWAEIHPDAQAGDSLVGAAFPSADPEGDFAHWLSAVPTASPSPKGIHLIRRGQADEIAAVLSRCDRSNWVSKVEPLSCDAPLFGSVSLSVKCTVPHALGDALTRVPTALTTLEHLGIEVSQGLRTGCNDFFYVDLVDFADEDSARIRLSALFGRVNLVVPADILVPVLRRQSELDAFLKGLPLTGRILNLAGYVLPEDYADVDRAKPVYEQLSLTLPAIMPAELASHVRQAAASRKGADPDANLIPDLSAVRTNVRAARMGCNPKTPRFWYMLPDLARRHLPDVFVPRINQRTPRAIRNRCDPVVIDANFSTVWPESGCWTAATITTLLRSSWSRACMEAIGTPMGGGALKLEATHLRRLPMPAMDDEHIRQLESIGEPDHVEAIDRVFASALWHDEPDDRSLSDLIDSLRTFTKVAEQARQRV